MLTWEISMSPGITITVLVDNHTFTDRYLAGEPGLSIFLEADGKRILFDLGFSDLFLRNAATMGIDLHDLETIVLSHGHLDHTGGLVPLMHHLVQATIEKVPCRYPALVAHPYCFYPRPKPPLPDIGSILSLDRVSRFFPVTATREPHWITGNLVFLGEIEHRFGFEAESPGTRKIVMPDGSEMPDRLLDDSALAYRSDRGLVVITGCSHAGICNIIEQAKKVCGDDRIVDVIGGLHLLSPTKEELEGTIAYLSGLGLEALHACHCTSLAAKIAIAAKCPLQETGVGLKIGY